MYAQSFCISILILVKSSLQYCISVIIASLSNVFEYFVASAFTNNISSSGESLSSTFSAYVKSKIPPDEVIDALEQT